MIPVCLCAGFLVRERRLEGGGCRTTARVGGRKFRMSGFLIERGGGGGGDGWLSV